MHKIGLSGSIVPNSKAARATRGLNVEPGEYNPAIDLLTNGFSCHGVEPSRNHAEFSRSRGNVIFEGFCSLTQKYDNLLHYYVLEHVFDPKKFLKLCMDQIKPGGRMIFEIPHREDALLSLYGLGGYRDFIMQKMHLFYYSMEIQVAFNSEYLSKA